MEGVVAAGESKGSFRDCIVATGRNPFLLYLAFSAAIGSLLFGYDTGVISGAILYIRKDFKAVDKNIVLQETVVTMAVAGAIIGATLGGWMSDVLGRRTAMLLGDLFFFIGSAVMSFAANPSYLIVGRIIVGVGVGISSLTSPLYVAESSPTNIRGALVSVNGVLVSLGTFLSFVVNLAFAKTKGTWRWMLGVAAIPAVLQFVFMLLLPESPRWLFRKKREEEAIRVLRKIHEEKDVEFEIENLKESIEAEKKEKESSDSKINLTKMLRNKAVRRGLIVGASLQAFQQFVGINTVMYYSTTIIQFAGFASDEKAIMLSLISAAIVILGTIYNMIFIDRLGRRKILIISLCGIILSLGLLTAVFRYSEVNSPQIILPEGDHLSPFTCPTYLSSGHKDQWDCTQCLATPSEDCGFCASATNKLLPGSCVALNGTANNMCEDNHRTLYTKGCPSKYGWLAVLGLALYVLAFTPGMGCVTWVINSEIYPLRYRGVCSGIAATANWVANLIVTQTFLSLSEAIGISFTFMIYGVVGMVALIFVVIYVPETRGLHIEEVEKMLAESSVQLKFWKKNSDGSKHKVSASEN